MSRRQLHDSLKARGRRNLKTSGSDYRFIIWLPLDERALKQCLDLRREGEVVPAMPVVEWLDANLITGGEEFSSPRIEDREREHSVELAQAVSTPHLVSAKNYLRVAGGLEME